MIHFTHIIKKYGTHEVLKNITLEIQPEEFVCIVGPTGAGKSTLLHLLIGAEKPDSGSVQIDDLKIHEMSSKELASYRQKIGIVFQDPKLLPQKTVFENVAFPLETTNHHDAYIHARVLEVLYTVGLANKHAKFPHELSGGERQKVALARALVANPTLLIADEPTGNLDPKATEDFINLLLKINKNGATIIIVTHNEKIVADLKNFNKRIIAMKEGAIMRDEKMAP